MATRRTRVGPSTDLRRQYLIRWEGYGPEDDTWELRCDVLAGSRDLIELYESQGESRGLGIRLQSRFGSDGEGDVSGLTFPRSQNQHYNNITAKFNERPPSLLFDPFLRRRRLGRLFTQGRYEMAHNSGLEEARSFSLGRTDTRSDQRLGNWTTLDST